jgi:hypothetical protein
MTQEIKKDRKIRKLQEKLLKKDRVIANLEKRVLQLERNYTPNLGKAVEDALERSLCNMRMIPTWIGREQRIVEINVKPSRVKSFK